MNEICGSYKKGTHCQLQRHQDILRNQSKRWNSVVLGLLILDPSSATAPASNSNPNVEQSLSQPISTSGPQNFRESIPKDSNSLQTRYQIAPPTRRSGDGHLLESRISD